MTTDRPAHETEREIEVTPEMIEAGRDVARLFDPCDYLSDDVLTLVYEKMGNYRVDVPDPSPSPRFEGDKPARNEDAEIEVTPEMIKAGVAAYALWSSEDLSEWIVEDVFRAMKLACSK